MSTTKLDKIVKTYKSLAQIPALIGAKLGSNGLVTSVWSQRNLEKGKTTKFQRSFAVNSSFAKLTETHPSDISDELLSKVSKSEKFRAVLRDCDSKQFLEVWQHGNLIRNVDLGALDVHGNVYTDVEFAALEWSPDERKLLYVAEKKVPKSEPFYKRKGTKDEGAGDSPTPKSRGEEYTFTQDWGEQLVGKKQSVLAEYTIETDSVEILSGVPENRCIAQPRYSPNGAQIVAVAYDTEPRKLGLIYCSNRPSYVCALTGNEYVELLGKGKSVKSPRFTPDGDFVIWLQRSVGGPHAHCMELVKAKAPINANSGVEVVVPLIEKSIQIEKGSNPFYGLYNNGFPARCWASNNKLIFSTNGKYTVNTYIIDIQSKNITEVIHPDASSLFILDVHQDTILVAVRNCLKPDKLAIGSLQADNSVKFVDLTESETVEGLENIERVYMDLKAQTDATKVEDFNAIYIGPKKADKSSVPLVVWPHGGPHSAFADYLMMEAALFLRFGYGLLLINYRGSLGQGAASVDFLPSKVGHTDVLDCIQAVDVALAQFPCLNPDQVSLIGGSHGGFLVAHLSGQYPDKFKSVVARNPVIDIASMSIISDIPDWCYVEAGHEYTQQGPVDDKILQEMRTRSPIVHAHKVKAPTLLQIGSKDLRVPPHQGTDYYYRLKANNVKVKMNLYDDNHPLGTVPNEIDNIINTLLWVEEHIGRTD